MIEGGKQFGLDMVRAKNKGMNPANHHQSFSRTTLLLMLSLGKSIGTYKTYIKYKYIEICHLQQRAIHILMN